MASIVWLCFSFFVILCNASAENASAYEFLSNLRGCHKGDNCESISMLKKYLQNIGYISFDPNNTNISSNSFDDLLESALKKYQSYYNLNVTGVMEDNTASFMSQPRCGVPDFSVANPDYTFFPGTYSSNNLKL